MAEKVVIAHRVRLVQAAPSDATGLLGMDWNEQKVSDLVIFPETSLARCRIKTGDVSRTLVGRFSWAEVDDASQADWERPRLGCICPDCGQPFENAQGLGFHRASKHPQSQAQKAQQSKRGA